MNKKYISKRLQNLLKKFGITKKYKRFLKLYPMEQIKLFEKYELQEIGVLT